MDELDDIESDGSSADSWESDLGNNFLGVGRVKDADSWSS